MASAAALRRKACSVRCWPSGLATDSSGRPPAVRGSREGICTGRKGQADADQKAAHLQGLTRRRGAGHTDHNPCSLLACRSSSTLSMNACTSGLRAATGTAWARARRRRRKSAPGFSTDGAPPPPPPAPCPPCAGLDGLAAITPRAGRCEQPCPASAQLLDGREALGGVSGTTGVAELGAGGTTSIQGRAWQRGPVAAGQMQCRRHRRRPVSACGRSAAVQQQVARGRASGRVCLPIQLHHTSGVLRCGPACPTLHHAPLPSAPVSPTWPIAYWSRCKFPARSPPES